MYLLGIPFKIVTNSAAFKMIMSTNKLSTRIARWALYLEDFDYVIEHHVDYENKKDICFEQVSDIHDNNQRNTRKGKLSAMKLLTKDESYEDFFLDNEILYKHKDETRLLFLPKTMQMKTISKLYDEI